VRVSAQALQRRLLEEEITFHDLVEEARPETAQRYAPRSPQDRQRRIKDHSARHPVPEELERMTYR
jgi:hypothetical protein